MRLLLAAVLLLCGVPAAPAENAALRALLAQAGVEEPPEVAAVAGSLACVMTFEYKETVKQLLLIRFWKEIEGDATVTCPGEAPVRLRLQGSGPSLGVGLPNGSPFTSVNDAVAGSVSVRVPAPFVPHHLEGDYVSAGVEVGGVGAGLSPWVNTDASLRMTIHLPGSFNASAGINLQTLRLYLMP